MGKTRIVTERISLRYAKHEFDPAGLLTFVQLDGFPQDWKQLRLDERDMKALRVLISSAPGRAPVMPGTGGLRKVRFSPPASHRGKSAGVRVCYAYFEDYGVVLLAMAYPKNRKDNLSARERNEMRKALNLFKRRLEEGPLQ